MLLVDSLYINSGGGKILLDYLVEQLEKTSIEVFYLFDDRCKGDYQKIPNSRKQFLKASLYNRYRFYKNNEGRFFKIFCFGNIPPITKQKVQVVTYFHQLLYVKKNDRNLPLRKKLKLTLQKLFLMVTNKNANIWYVQIEAVRKSLSEKYKIDINKIELMPFYPPILSDGNKYERAKNSYIYVSNGSTHKNQRFLLKSFCQFYDKTKRGSLTLTIADNSTGLLDIIQEKQNLGYPIDNLGFVNRDELYKHYQTHEYLIFPSLAESFGLGIVESIENGCKVIGADLGYMHDVCVPSFTFNPYNEDDLIKCLEISSKSETKESYSRISNQIKQLLNKLS